MEQLEDLAEIWGAELVVIDADTELRSFRQGLRNNDAYFQNKRSF
jgi:L-arabinose isomerase